MRAALVLGLGLGAVACGGGTASTTSTATTATTTTTSATPPPAELAPAPAPASASRYPLAPHGEPADDPYRRLEAMDAKETRDWVAAENKLTDAALADAPGTTAFRDRLAQLYAVEQNLPPVHRGAFYTWARRDADHDQHVIMVASSADGAARVLLDPSDFAKDGSLQLAGTAASLDGKIYAYGLADGGGDWTRWHFRDVATGKDLPDVLPYAKYYAPAFAPDGRGVYYSRFPAPKAGAELTETDHDCKLYFHKFGTAIEQDRVVYERPDQPTWQFEPRVTRDGRYLLFAMGDGEVGDSNMEQIGVLDLKQPGAKITLLVDRYEAEYLYVGNRGSTLYYATDLHAPNKKIVAVDASAAKPVWRDVVAQSAHAIDDAVLVGDRLLVSELRDAHAALVAYDLPGSRFAGHDLPGKHPRELALPGIGTLWGISGRPGDPEVFYHFASYTQPGTTYRLDLKTGASTPWRAPALAFDPAQFQTQQIFFAGKDGVKVPMFVTAKKDLPTGAHPTVMTAYGFGGISLTPYFSPDVLAWIERGGVAVEVNVRGGGEYGAEWHHAAWREHEQVKLDDFAAAGEWLIANGWTTAKQLGAYGTSGGGFLVGAVAVQRPELFGAVAPIAGVHDLLRFHLFGQGAGWQNDLGHPDVPAEATWLRKVSPLHNVRPGASYPAMYIVTSDHDVRVPPLHSYKYAAALQAAQAGPAPILLRVDTESGHGGGGLRSQKIAQQSELLAFFAKYLGLPVAE